MWIIIDAQIGIGNGNFLHCLNRSSARFFPRQSAMQTQSFYYLLADSEHRIK